MKALGITLGLVVLIAMSSTAMATDIWSLPMGNFKVQFTFGPPTTFVSYMDGLGQTRAGMFMHNLAAGAPEHVGDGATGVGMLHGVKLSDIAQMDVGYLDVDDLNAAGVVAPYFRSGTFNFVIDWDGDLNPATQDPGIPWANVGARTTMDLIYHANTGNAGGPSNLTQWTSMPLNQWHDLKITPHMPIWQIGPVVSAEFIRTRGGTLYDPNQGVTVNSNHLSLNQIAALFPNATFIDNGGWAWPTPETTEITVDWAGFEQPSGQIYDYWDIYTGTRLKGDCNGDKSVDVGDLGILSAGWGTSATYNALTSNLRYAADLNNDYKVDVGDLGLLSADWGSTIASTWTTFAQNNFTDVPGGLDLGGSAVPLPSAFGAGLVMMGLAARRRR